MLSKTQGHHPFVQLGTALGRTRVSFKLGEVFWGQVLECQSKGEVSVAAKGARFKAHTTLPLAPGSQYEFFVQQERPQLILRVMDFGSPEPCQRFRMWGLHAAARASFARLLQNLIRLAETSATGRQARLALQQLRDLLPGLICSGLDSLDARWLAKQLSSQGLFWESKVARWLAQQGAGKTAQLAATDLKGTLLALLEGLERSDMGGLSQDLKTMAAQALEFVELQQQLNLLGGPQSAQWFWFIPGEEGQGLHSAEVFVEEQGEEDGVLGRSGPVRLRVRVELSRLGAIEASVSLQQEEISCHMLVAEEELAGWIDSKLPQLNVALEQCGFKVAFLGCEAGNVPQLPPFLLSPKGQGSALLCVVV